MGCLLVLIIITNSCGNIFLQLPAVPKALERRLSNPPFRIKRSKALFFFLLCAVVLSKGDFLIVPAPLRNFSCLKNLGKVHNYDSQIMSPKRAKNGVFASNGSEMDRRSPEIDQMGQKDYKVQN